MVRPNGSVIGRNDGADGRNTVAVMQIPDGRATVRWETAPCTRNLGTLPPAYNPQTCLLQCKQSAGGRRRGWWWWRVSRRIGEWRSGGRWWRRRRTRILIRPLGRFWFLRPHDFLVGGPWRRTRRLKLGNHRIGIEPGRGRGDQIAGHADALNRHGRRLETVQGEGNRETIAGKLHVDGAWCLATRPHGCAGVGSRRRRLELDRHAWRGRLEHVQRIRGAASQAKSRYGNHDDTTHGPSVTIVRLTATIPTLTIGASAQRCNRVCPNR
jgi:hypothetical protein